MKRTLLLILVFLMILTGISLCGAASADRVQSGGFSYELLSDGTASIVDCTLSGDVVIPSTIDGYKVTNLGRELFYGRSGVTSVSIPATVTYFGKNKEDNMWDYVFSYCYSLKSITVDPDNPTFCSVDGVLYTKDKLILINYPVNKAGAVYHVPEDVTDLCCTSFASANNLEDLYIDGYKTIWYNYTFYQCPDLTVNYKPGGKTEKKALSDIEDGASYEGNPNLWPKFHNVDQLEPDEFAPAVIAPERKTDLVYNGKAQALVEAGEVTGGTLYYAINDDYENSPPADKFSREIPKATNAGNYYVWYMAKGDADHHDTEPDNVFCFILEAQATITADDKTKVHGEADPEFTATVTGTVAGEKLIYTLNRIPGESAGEYTIKVEAKDNPNYEVTTVNGTLTIKPGTDTGIITAPKAKTDLVENGKQQELITAGKAEEGTFYYGLSADEKGKQFYGYSTAIPTASKAGTYYVWYQLVGNYSYAETEPTMLKVTIAEKEKPAEEKKTEEKKEEKKEEEKKPEQGFTGITYDANRGWWVLMKNGVADTGYTGLYNDAAYGCWFILNGEINIDYTGLFNDQNEGWCLISNGEICSSYTGLWNDPNYGWWLIDHGTIAWNYTGLWNDPNYGWWLIGGGQPAWNYTGLWNDPTYGWWLIDHGAIAWGYTGLWNDPNCGWWLINKGTIDWEFTGGYDAFDTTWQIVNGQLVN